MADLFDKEFNINEEPKKKRTKKESTAKKANKDNISETPLRTNGNGEEKDVYEYVNREFSVLHSSFESFVKDIEDLVVFEIIKPFVVDLAKSCENLGMILLDEVQIKRTDGVSAEYVQFVTNKAKEEIYEALIKKYGQDK